MNPAFDIFSWHGTIGRQRYLITGLILFALKHNVDRVLGYCFGYQWGPFNYVVFLSSSPQGILGLQPEDAGFYTALLLAALPFIWVGTVLTERRLRDAGLPLWLVIVFFLPLLNLIFFVILASIPSRESTTTSSRLSAKIGRFIPESELGSAVFGIGVTTLLTAVEVVFTTNGLGNYGWGLFVGIPFFLGLSSTMIYSYHQPRGLGKCLLVATLSTAFVGAALFAIAVEGVICLMMALPLALVLALFGALIGWAIQHRPAFATSNLRVVSIGFIFLPGLILAEYGLGEAPPLYEVKTSVVIKSDIETVWTHVVTFSELPPPTEMMFKTGLAYPIRAEMHGKGAGAVRHCIFSTGPFVEPITTWDEPRLLQFDVSEQPRAMDELSLYNDLRPPHLDNYFIARRGQFALKSLPDGTTLLEGTTWYQNRFWPAPYWHLWSDYIINGIHNRVLLHIKTLAEKTAK